MNTPSGRVFPSVVILGEKNPWASHQSYHAASTTRGSYPLGRGLDTSPDGAIQIWIPQDRPPQEGRLTFLLTLRRDVNEDLFSSALLFLSFCFLLRVRYSGNTRRLCCQFCRFLRAFSCFLSCRLGWVWCSIQNMTATHLNFLFLR